ncbi:immunoglobulin-like domain-containing protein [Gorillibacterium sp. CAU 1737]|uniref:immunoglobulin-like domain-containing protein n=1 Tax=Gorillibacterium sp. CAU 1737 TaxID=3140362 RepID=UPI00325FE667
MSRKMVLKAKVSLFLVFTMILSLLSPLFAPAVASAASGNASIDVAVALGNSGRDIRTFENDLKSVLEQVYGISKDEVNVNVFETANVKATNPNNWQTYDHYYAPEYPTNGSVPANWDDHDGHHPYDYYKEQSTPDPSKYFTDISTEDLSLTATYYRLKHVYAKGGDIHFLGYSAPSYKDFMLYPDTSKYEKNISYTLSEGKIDTHTLEGAGFLFNAATVAGKLNGYLVLYDYSDYAEEPTSENGQLQYHPNVKLYKLTNVDVSGFHNAMNSTIPGMPGVSLLKTKPSQASSSIKSISMDVSADSLRFVENGVTIFDTKNEDRDVTITDTNGYGFGPLVSYVAHGCTILTYFSFKNITMTSKDTRPFSEVVRGPEWNPGSDRYLVNFNDDVEKDFTQDKDTRSEVLYRLGKDDVHYVGVGKEDPTLREETEKLVADNNGKGTFISEEDYQETLKAIAAYINENRKAAQDESALPVASIVYTNEDGLQSASTDPNGEPLNELWKWQAVGESTNGYTLGKPDVGTDFTNANGYYLVNLQVVNQSGKWSKPDVAYLSQNGLALPVADFSVNSHLVRIHENEKSIVLKQEAFHPAQVAIDEYAWTLFDSMGNKVLTSSDPETTIDATTLSTDTYTVELKVKSGEKWSSPYTQKVTVINDQTPPQIETNAASNRTVSNAEFKIMDIGGSGIYGYQVKKNDESWSEWVVGTSGTIEAGTYSSYSIRAKDNAGNVSEVTFTTLEVKDTKPPVFKSISVKEGTIGKYSTTFTVEVNEPAKVYYVAVPAGVPAPSIVQVKNGQNAQGTPAIAGSIAAPANSLTDIKVTGLSPETAYDIYVIAEDSAGNLSVRQAMHAETKPLIIPTLEAEVAKVNQTSVNVKAKSTEAGTIYYVVTEKGAAAPSKEQLFAGQNGEGKKALAAGSSSAQANADTFLTVDDLQLETEYDLYAIVRNLDEDAVSSVVKLSFKTLDNHLEMAQADAEALKIGYTGGDSEIRVTRDVALLQEGVNGSEITWTSSHPEFLSETGVFTKPDVDTFVVLTATIKHGEQIVTKTFTVKVVADITPPVITLAGEPVVTVKKGNLYNEPGFTASDNVDGTITGEVEVLGYVNTNKPGTYTLTYRVKDKTGNVTEITRTIIVTDEVSPESIIPAKNGDVITDKKVDDAVQGAKDNGETTVTVKVDQPVTEGQPVSVELTKEQVQKAADNGLTLTLETENTSIEVPITAELLAALPEGSRLKLVCEYVDPEKPGNEALIAAVKPGMGIYEKQVYDFKMVAVKLSAWGNVVSEEVIPSFTSDKDITLGMVIGKGITDRAFMTFYFNETKGAWEYIRGQYDSESGRMTLLTRHLSIYSVMTMTLEQKRQELLKLINEGDLNRDEVLSILEDPDMGFHDEAVEAYEGFADPSRDKVAEEVQKQAPYGDYEDLVDSFDRIVLGEKTDIAADLIAPVVTLKGDATVVVLLGRVFTDPGATAKDNLDGDITGRIIVLGSVDTETVGDYVLTYTVRDQNGNLGKTERTVRVLRDTRVNPEPTKPEPTPDIITKGKDTVVVKEIPVTQIPAPAGDSKRVSDGYEVTPAVPGTPAQVTLVLPYDPALVTNEDHVSIFYYDEVTKTWKSAGGVVDKEKNTVTLTLTLTDAKKVAVLEKTVTFKDIQGHWAQSVIELLASRGILEGDLAGNYNPNMGITRAEFATLVAKILELPISKTNTGFNDVSEKDWYAPYIAAARDAGVIKGISDIEYEPNRIVNRQEMAAIIMRAYRTSGNAVPALDLTKFADSDKIGFWAYDDVYEAKALGFVEGRGGDAYQPKDKTLKGEAAMLIYRFLKVLDKI